MKQNMTLKSGNFICDLSDYLPNYTLVANVNAGGRNRRPLVRILSIEKLWRNLNMVALIWKQ